MGRMQGSVVLIRVFFSARVRKWMKIGLGMLVVARIYVYFFIVVITPLELNDDKPIDHVCEYLDTERIEERQRGLGKPVKDLKIALLTFEYKMDPDVVRESRDNQRRYAQKHGYTYLVTDQLVDTSLRPAPWSKFPIIKRFLPEYDFIVWLDTDALIANYTVKIEDVVNGKSNLFFAEDESQLNSGVFIIRNSPWSLWWLNEAAAQSWLVSGSHPFKYEQRAIHFLYGTERLNKDARKHGQPMYPRAAEVQANTEIVPYCALNSNICEEFWFGFMLYRRPHVPGWHCANKYENGDFILHLAGRSPSSYRDWLFLKFKPMIDSRGKRLGLW
uniref:Uncharacterized protein n=1 Tax=Mucochytrium quahogii TaxID=96639 RepID=A0A7S2WSY7_9STRA|mmetsp:Transcript_8292/g.18080  ORF Transcript_8292/g.18080 Transcript_8292/m.18080 type:complete len:330 (+) Transcript_8292:123-1112(+)